MIYFCKISLLISGVMFGVRIESFFDILFMDIGLKLFKMCRMWIKCGESLYFLVNLFFLSIFFVSIGNMERILFVIWFKSF